MKKLLAIVLCLALCMGVLAVTATAASTVVVAGYAGLCNGYAWDTSKNAMTLQADGTYTITFANVEAGYYQFKIVDNGSWIGDPYADNSDGNWHITLTATTDVVINYDPTTKNVTTNVGGATVVETITVHAKVPTTWGEANAYVWNSSTNNTWPGAAMTLGSDGWYTVEIPAWAENIIINKNGSPQTQDMVLPDADEIWIVVEGTTGTIYTANPDAGAEPEPEPAVTIDQVGIRGDSAKLAAVNWDSDVAMTKTSDEGYGVWEYTFKNVPAETWPTIKFTVNGGWGLNFGCEDDTVGATSGTAHNAVYNGSNLWFEVKEESDVHVKLDLTNYDATAKTGATYTITLTAAVTEEPDPESTTLTVHAKVPEDWTAAYVQMWLNDGVSSVHWTMTLGDDGWYTHVFSDGADYIIIKNGDGGQTQDMALTGATEIWIVVEANEDGSFTGTLTETNPNTGDDLIAICAAMLLAGAAVVTTAAGKKRFF